MFITYPDARYLSGCVVPGGGPPALRASLGASTRCPSRPRRPCGGLRPGCGRLGSATSGVAVSHAIPPEYLACSYHFVYLSHSCSGIACDFGEGGCWRVGGMWHGRVVRERDAGERRGGVGREMGWRGVPQFRMQFPLSTLLVRIASYI